MGIGMGMDSDLPTRPCHASYFSGCMASPSWLPSAARRSPGRFHLLERVAGHGGRGGGSGRLACWRKLVRRLVQESKCICSPSPRPLTFGYDAASYAKNFDDDGRRPAAAVEANAAGKSAGR